MTATGIGLGVAVPVASDVPAQISLKVLTCHHIASRLMDMTNNLKFKRSDYHSGYVAELPNGDFYHVEKTERILLGRFGGGTTHTFWKADYVKVDADATVNKYTRIPLLVGSKYAPTEFTSKIGDTKREAVIACQGHADGADNVQH